MFNFGIKVKTNKIPGKLDKAFDYAQNILDQQVLKDSNYYIPVDRGNLRESGITHSQIGKGKVVWSTKYARRLYYNPQYNFSHDKNANARGLWYEEAKANKLKSWLNLSKKAAKSKI